MTDSDEINLRERSMNLFKVSYDVLLCPFPVEQTAFLLLTRILGDKWTWFLSRQRILIHSDSFEAYI